MRSARLRRADAHNRQPRAQTRALQQFHDTAGEALLAEDHREVGLVRDFLERPHPMLDDNAPLEVALATGPGADAVINLMGRAAYSGGV